MTAQEIFNIVWERFVVQNAPRAVRPEPGGEYCVYRREADDARCAVGALLTLEEAEAADKEGGPVGNLYDARVLPARLRPHFSFLVALQRIHDYDWKVIDTPTQRRNSLTYLADDYGLTVPATPEPA